MFQPVSLFVGLRYAKSSKGNAFISFISFFSIAGIALGLMSLITVSSVMNGFEQTLKSAMLDMIPHVQLKPERKLEVPGQIKKQLAELSSVKRIQPYLTSDVILQTNEELLGVRLQGVFKGGVSLLEAHIESGSIKQFQSGKYQLAISRYLANSLKVQVGSQIRVIMPEVTSYSPMGRLPAQRLFTVAIIYNSKSEADTQLAFSDGQSLAKLMRKKSEAELDISVSLHDAFSLDDFYKEFASLQTTNLKAIDWQVQQGALFAAVAMEKRVMSLLLGLIVLVAIFNIISGLSMMVKEKQGEVAILQTIGFTPAMISKVFMIQGLYNGVIGTLLGLFAGLLLANYINEVMSLIGVSLLGGLTLPVKFELTGLIIMAALSILLSFVATLYPAKQAAKVMPAEVLRYE
ncbi:lipoprotein-releasing ABC transporter permease subunit [Pseudoalteromonas phenolica]|uniref:Lipoprotein releasing system, transmembrane protein, LolC/E family n=1 Tax=Pseudoalteromonas phenolica TaxID=161398 RepID=A0A0S2K1N3_9GAMM|nr:lipoprotein-releasing ABC transporter permease subunit [Pseudoalteromonas phenolica]ALO41983.1 Lipoprotein releasing system, transmembrane protein, LolC/E family [Pseudoalteromonas phenolica]MBE0353455.1 lipoprotein-releasing system permease protein [Pseudoalteromonas phenolica O-BC30]RXE99538.1 lipoprotein-releasing ABC transporter permease subunit [Pseudoalteromonas phenolica O-BC30]